MSFSTKPSQDRSIQVLYHRQNRHHIEAGILKRQSLVGFYIVPAKVYAKGLELFYLSLLNFSIEPKLLPKRSLLKRQRVAAASDIQETTDPKGWVDQPIRLTAAKQGKKPFQQPMSSSYAHSVRPCSRKISAHRSGTGALVSQSLETRLGLPL